jgi:hypothetical protein
LEPGTIVAFTLQIRLGGKDQKGEKIYRDDMEIEG